MRSLMIILTFLQGYCLAQDTSSIKYYFSDAVESLIYKHIKSIEAGSEDCLYLQLDKDTGIYKLILTASDEKDSRYWWVKSSARMAVVGPFLIPLLFDYDEVFSTSEKTIAGTMGNRNEYILKGKSIFHNVPIIYFDCYGKIIKALNWRQRIDDQ